MSDTNAVSRDFTKKNESKLTRADFLKHASAASGRGSFELSREFFRLHRGPGKLTFDEYVQFGVFDTKRHTAEDQARFITNTLHWPITHKCCDMTWQATTEDKWLCSHILSQSDIPMPETLAIIDRTLRAYPGNRKIETAEQLRDFVTAADILPFFGKENRGIASFGAFLAEGADDTHLHLKGEEPVTYQAFLDQFVGTVPYLLQKLERNHGFFDRYTDNLATVRVCILVTKAGVKIPFTVLKLPTRDNVADSFWRPGNLACNVEVDTGKITTVRSKTALTTTDYDTHPDSGAPLLGEVLPMWDELLDLARRCAEIFAPVRYQSMDIALTERGPVVIEVNTGGGFDLPQLASGQGFLTNDVRDFFRECGWDKL